ncbi:MAG: nicotinate phosphoribosyltransferase, partial [Sarcina sp.]
YKLPTIDEIQKKREAGVESLWDEIKRFENPHQYYVDLSQKLWDLKAELINKFS